MHGSKVIPKRRFQLVLIKPSHYGDDGYVIRWWRSMIPSNSLASTYGIAVDSAARAVLGADVDIDIDAVDEFNSRVDISKLLQKLARNENFGLVPLIVVQSNQYPRALDIARRFDLDQAVSFRTDVQLSADNLKDAITACQQGGCGKCQSTGSDPALKRRRQKLVARERREIGWVKHQCFS
jgi:hypothetical protein